MPLHGGLHVGIWSISYLLMAIGILQNLPNKRLEHKNEQLEEKIPVMNIIIFSFHIFHVECCTDYCLFSKRVASAKTISPFSAKHHYKHLNSMSYHPGRRSNVRKSWELLNVPAKRLSTGSCERFREWCAVGKATHGRWHDMEFGRMEDSEILFAKCWTPKSEGYNHVLRITLGCFNARCLGVRWRQDDGFTNQWEIRKVPFTQIQ